jgi:hypothetical protein
MDKIQKQAIDYSKIPHEDVTDTYRYVNLPRRFFEALAQGSITPLMFNVLAWIWARAGYKTGIAKRVTAQTIIDELYPADMVPKKVRPSVSTIQRVLRQLADLGYITLPTRYKHRKNYSIVAHGYVALVEGRKLSLRPKETKAYGDRDDEFDAPSEAPSEAPMTLPCGTDDASLSGESDETGEARRSKSTSSSNSSSAAAAADVLADSSSSTGNPKPISPDVANIMADLLQLKPGESFSSALSKPKSPVEPVQPKPETPAVKPSSQPPPNPPPTEEAAGFAARFADLRSRPVSPDDTRKFAALLRDYPGCGYLLDFALIPGSKTAGDIRDARSPLAYLKSGLKDGWLQDRWDEWEEKKAAHEQIQADRAKQPSESKPDDEDFRAEPKAETREWDLSGLED